MEKHGRKIKMEEEAKQYLTEKVRMAESALDKWSKNSIGVGLVDLYNENPEKARMTAMMLENQESHMKRLSETIISQTFQTRPENVLKVVRIGTANSKRGDIFTEVPLTTTDDAIYYINMTYENTIAGKQQTAADLLYEKAYFTSVGENQYKDTVGNGGAGYTITPDHVPIIPGKVLILLDGVLVAYDDGALGFTKVGAALTTGSINSYAAGVVSLTFAAIVPITSTIRVISHFDSENSNLYPYYPKVSLDITKQRFSARPMPLGYTYTLMTNLVLETTGLGGVEDHLLAAVGDEHAKAKDYRAIARAVQVAKGNTNYTFNANFAAEGEISDKLHAQKLLSCINDISGALYNDIKRGVINKVVAGSQVVTYMKKHDLWKDDLADVRTGVFKAGTLSDIEVFQCPADAALVPSNGALLTYKNPLQPLDIGLVFGVLTELTASLTYPQMYVDGNICVVEDNKLIQPKFMRYLTLTGLPTY